MSKGRLLLIISAVTYGILPTLASAAYRGGINGITFTFLRGAISIIPLYAVIKTDKRRLRLSSAMFRKTVILCFFGGALPIVFLYMSYNYISTGVATTLHFVYPVIIVIVEAVLCRERMSRNTMSAAIFVTAGIFMFSDFSVMSNRIGIILAVLSGVFYSFYIIYLERSGLAGADYIVLTFYNSVIMSMTAFLFGIFTDGISLDFEPMSWALAFVISFAASVVAMPLFQIGVRLEGAAAAGILSALEPITSVVSGALFLHEPLSYGQIMGCGTVILGVLLARRGTETVRGAAGSG